MSASDTIVGSRRIGVPGRPRSPEKTMTVSRPAPGAVSRIRTMDEPRMWPASTSVMWTPWATSCSEPYGMWRSIGSVALASSSVYRGSSRPSSTMGPAARSRSSGSGPPGLAAPSAASSTTSSKTCSSRASRSAARSGSRRSRRDARLANSSWSRAESRSTRRASSALAAVHQTLPRNPSWTSNGSRPQWSRCAWVSTTASSVAGSTPSGTLLRMDSSGPPWNMPQSTSTRARPVSTRWREPVTVRAPPRKVSSIRGS